MDKKYVWFVAGLIVGYLFLGNLLGGVSGLVSGGLSGGKSGAA